MDIQKLYEEFQIMVEQGNDYLHMVRFMEFINKCIKTNSIMNDVEDDGVSDCDSYYITACATRNPYEFSNDNAVGIKVHDYYYCKRIHNFFILTSCQLSFIEMLELLEFINNVENNFQCIPYSNVLQLS
jgi:hypothetical protein